ncbi:serine/threonine-protein kinase [Actinocrispum wychmicini]|uniref:non-specific serine/threonine protein kinase n=1 Tax=Actinocrispum wychmicini TaxID=1213861 RepID=A0A4R2IJ44_9PSEU|nr:serine/threonine-protein kinase [Actinocrispum wychmicini]TCO44256.1 serine/threonine protein kinase [Actinocrispum wychmicini]
MEHSALMRQIGSQIANGRYTLVRELGRGGMGVVWLATDSMLGRDVAVKELLLPHNVPADEVAVYQERVLREARIASRLANAAVVTVHDLIQEAGQTFIVMEYVQAPTLTELVERDGPMPTVRAARLAEQLLSALESAHDAGIVHRDVKPGNVMVPAKDTAKLTDFGIAQTFDDPRLTSTGALIGSPAYMSPERLEGGEVSPAWDLWALGATLFFAVEGFSAYQRQTTSATMLAVMTERPEPRRCTGPLAELVMGLLEPDPERRLSPARARQLIGHAISGNFPIDPPTVRTAPVPLPVPMPPRQMLPVHPPAKRKRHVGLLVAGAAVPLVLVVVLIVALTQKSGGGQAVDTGSGSGSSSPSATLPSTPGQQPYVPATSSSTPKKVTPTKAMVPVMTNGPGGDIVDTMGAMIDGDCMKWVPKKGGKAPDIDADTGCYGPYDVQVLTQTWADRELEKDKPYPGLDSLKETWASYCTQLFESKLVTTPNKDDVLRYWVFVPTEEAWKVKVSGGYRLSHRLVYCFVGRADGAKLTEPVMEKS